MPQVDTDTVRVIRTSRQNQTNLEIEYEWIDGVTGQSKGSFTSSFSTAAEFTSFMDQQDQEDVLRAVMGQCVRRDTGAFRQAQFDGLAGHTYQINTRVQQIL